MDLCRGDGATRVTFTSVEDLRAGASGNDTLIGPIADSAWQVDGPGSGTVGSLTFSGFENLTGEADNEDVFTFGPEGSLVGW